MNLQPKPPIVILALFVTPTYTSDILLSVLLKCDSRYTAGITGLVNFFMIAIVMYYALTYI